MAEDSDVEKTEPASGRRLERAREEGNVPRSREVGAFLILLVSAGVFWFVGSWVMQRMMLVVQRSLIINDPSFRDPQFMMSRFSEASFGALVSMSPLFLAVVIAALASPYFLGSWNFSAKALVPDLNRLNPVKGVSRLVSWNGLIELFKAVAKSLLVGGVAIYVLWGERGEFFAIFGQSVDVGLYSAGQLVKFSYLMIVLSMLVIVAIDVPFQLWQYYDKLKMSKEEVKQENKEWKAVPRSRGGFASCSVMRSASAHDGSSSGS